MSSVAQVANGPSNESRERATDDRPIAQIVSDLWVNTETLIRQELQLGLADAEQRAQAFKAELNKDVAVLKHELLIKAVGGVVALIGGLTLTAAVVLLLANELPAWLSALIVGLVISGAAAVMLMRSMRTPELPDARELAPKRAAHSVKEDVNAIQEAMK